MFLGYTRERSSRITRLPIRGSGAVRNGMRRHFPTQPPQVIQRALAIAPEAIERLAMFGDFETGQLALRSEQKIRRRAILFLKSNTVIATS